MDGGCKSDSGDILFSVCLEIVVLITLSNVFHLVLKRLGQPSIISQLLAGVVAAKIALGRLEFTENDNEENLDSLVMVSRMLFMFLLGLEMDLDYIWRTGHRSVILASGGAAACVALGAIFAHSVHSILNNSHGCGFIFFLDFVLLLASTSSPVVVRIVTELKLTNSEIGRLAIAAALIVDLACFLILAVAVTLPDGDDLRGSGSLAVLSLLMIVVTAAAVGTVRWIVKRMNACCKSRRNVRLSAVVALLFLVIVIAIGTEALGYNCMMSCFLMGLVVPREGPTARTLIKKLSYPVHAFVVPVYFGSTGMRMDMAMFSGDRWETAASWVVLMVGLSTLGKVAGTVAASSFLGIPVKEGVVLGFLLNVKGQVDVITISLAINQGVWDPRIVAPVLVTVFLNTLFASPLAAILVRKQRHAFRYRSYGLQWLQPQQELRLLVCVHDPDKARSILSLAEMSACFTGSPLTVYLLHLVELTQNNYSGEETRRVNIVVDAFTKETGISVRQITAASSYDTMYEDVCNGAEDVKASLVLLPFHKEQRYDGKMICRKEGRQNINLKVLRQAPCTVGIFVNRRLERVAREKESESDSESTRPPPSSTTSTLEHSARYVVCLFFGGPDDREALAYASRLAMHPRVGATVVRFKSAATSRDASASDSVGMGSSSWASSGVTTSIPDEDEEGDERVEDDKFLSNFYYRFVATGIVSYEEKLVRNGPETVAVLRSMVGMYSLFIVGRVCQTHMTSGLGEWNECPELGPIGDLLASHDFMDTGSVVILQHHDRSKDLEDISRADDMRRRRRSV
ncbi:cation/H(+) antiporter 15-like [Typha latifolia]|uniref:cation/H(+) antiporter 15-like n=1 Tax=Typha latifolia TaxID=4733 RepID=UPI003C2BCF03